MQGHEPDWKRFRKLREIALERLCERILERISEISGESDRSFHARYLDVYEYISHQDEALARAFNDPRRSKADEQLARMYAADLVTDAELEEFSNETKALIPRLAKVYAADESGRGT